MATELGPDPILDARLDTAAGYLRRYATLAMSEPFKKLLEDCACAVDEAKARLGATLAPGWLCGACGAFNSDAKERLSACRCCGMARR